MELTSFLGGMATSLVALLFSLRFGRPLLFLPLEILGDCAEVDAVQAPEPPEKNARGRAREFPEKAACSVDSCWEGSPCENMESPGLLLEITPVMLKLEI